MTSCILFVAGGFFTAELPEKPPAFTGGKRQQKETTAPPDLCSQSPGALTPCSVSRFTNHPSGEIDHPGHGHLDSRASLALPTLSRVDEPGGSAQGPRCLLPRGIPRLSWGGHSCRPQTPAHLLRAVRSRMGGRGDCRVEHRPSGSRLIHPSPTPGPATLPREEGGPRFGAESWVRAPLSKALPRPQLPRGSPVRLFATAPGHLPPDCDRCTSSGRSAA